MTSASSWPCPCLTDVGSSRRDPRDLRASDAREGLMTDTSIDDATDPRDEQIAQLEHALASRVVIEQAKGIIFERFGVSMAESFELLRQAARSHQIKIRALAERVVET